jgi:4-hydroxy-3-methylbut-2-enyl diphosphate reductase
LYELCKNINSKTYFVTEPNDLNVEWFNGIKNIGICGATSTPKWLMEEIAAIISKM